MVEYTAGLISKPFWYLETKITAKKMLEGLSRQEIRQLAIDENLYQTHAEYRAKEIALTTYRRLSGLPIDLIRKIAEGDLHTSKTLIIIAIMQTDRLFFEFMYEVFRNKLVVKEKTIGNKDLNGFFAYKSSQSEKVAKWGEKTINNLRKAYFRILYEAGFIQKEKDEQIIIRPFIDSEIIEIMKNSYMKIYLSAITGVD